MARKSTLLSLSGTIAVAHFCLFLLIVLYQRSFAGPDGSVRWTEDNRHVLQFLSLAMVFHMFPIGWLSYLGNWLHPTAADVFIFVVLVAANSALVGYVLAWIIRSVRAKRMRPPGDERSGQPTPVAR